MSSSPQSGENKIIRDVNCAPFPFSSDTWRRRTVRTLGRLIDRQATPPDRSVLLVIGPGGLPYLLGQVQVARTVVSDLHSHVIGTTLDRVAMLADHQNWASYRQDFIKIDPGTSHYIDPEEEFRLSQKSGLMSDYTLTREHAARTMVMGLEGNILKTAPALAEQLNAEDGVITLANFTNAADYCGGQKALRDHVLDVLPVANDVIIIDSAPNMKPRLYSLAAYGN